MDAYSPRTAATPSSSVKGDIIAYLSEVGLTFGAASNQTEVLREINLALAARDFVCVLGSSGCGKTSLLRILAGYQRPTQGTVLVSGKTHTQPNANVGVVFQRPNLFPWANITQNVGFGPKMKGVSKLERKQRVSYYLDMVGLTHAANRLPHQLSGGMLQRAAIARTLAADPTLVLMDEPFGALDALTRESMQIQLKEIWERTGKTIFFITHDVEEALLLSTRIVVMHAHPGRIVKEVANSFVNRLGHETAAGLRSSREFVETREDLVASIKESSLVNAGAI